MLPYNLLFKIGSKAVGSFMTRRAEKSERKHQIAYKKCKLVMKELKEMAH